MAVVSGYTISKEQAEELAAHNTCVSTDEEALGMQHYDLQLEPDGHVTVACLGCQTIIIEFYPEEEKSDPIEDDPHVKFGFDYPWEA